MKTIFDYVKEEETAFKTTHVTVADGYEFNMYEHVRMSTLFRDSKYTKGTNDYSRPFKNIIRRIRNLALVAMNIDVKDIVPFVNDAMNYYKSFLVKKYHPKWARKNNIDTYIDDTIESYEDFGLGLSKHENKIAPTSVPLASIAFCDQTSILSGPICIKHQYSPAELMEYDGVWGNESKGADITLPELITLARAEKIDSSGNKATKTPGKFIEVYELDGMFPKAWLKKSDEIVSQSDEELYSQQMHIIVFYKDSEGNTKGQTLFKGKGDPKKYKAIVRDPIFGRCCGMGGIEELFHPQIWTNYDEIRIQELLDAASKIVHITGDRELANRNDITDVENNQILYETPGANTRQLNTQPVNLVAFANAAERWEEHAKGIGSAYDAQLGESPTAGTPFKLQNAIIAQGESLHQFRQGKLATYFGEVYRDWVLDDLVTEMNNEQEFTEELSLDELQMCADALATYEANDRIKKMILEGGTPVQEQVDLFKELVKEDFMKGGSKRFFKTLKNELKGLPVDVEIDIKGKQKDLGKVADTMSNLLRQIMSNPQAFVATMQIPGASASFNDLIESTGGQPWRFNEITGQHMDAMAQASNPAPAPNAPLSPIQPTGLTPGQGQTVVK